MTCIVGIVEKEKVYIGGDSAGTAGYVQIKRKDPKVFIRGEFIIGYTSSFRMGQLLMFDDRFRIREQKENENNFEYMVNAFIPAIQELFNDGGYLKINNNIKEGGCFLVGYKNNLYRIESDFQVGESIENYSSVGCGEEIALGSLFTSKDLDISPEEKIIKALEASAYYSTGVAAPFIVLSK
jgi:ATP-dependent protease HslVU (ClpYQ) peptidase subunit